MMRKFKTQLAQRGFTLIELMIVVGIIGILVAIAAPNFSRYQSKARQSEAKIALAAVYGGEKSFYSEYAAYIGGMDAIGYAPEGAKRFYQVGWSDVSSPVVTGYSYTPTQANFPAVNNSFTCSGTLYEGTQMSGDQQTFIVVASGCVRQGAAYDTWNIDENKSLNNNLINL